MNFHKIKHVDSDPDPLHFYIIGGLEVGLSI